MGDAADLPIVPPRPPTDAELRDAAVRELEQTTVGYLNHKWPPPPPDGTHWKAALGYLARIGQPAPAPPATAWSWDAASATVNPAVDVSALIAECAPGVALSCSVALAYTDPASQGYPITSSSPYSGFDPLVYIPAGTQASSPDADGHLAILDPVHGRESDMEHGAYANGAWSCSEGNSFALGSVTAPARGAVTAAATPLRAGLIFPADLSGPTHTLVFSMDLSAISSSPVVFPGATDAQPGPGPASALPFGGWVRLPALSGPPPSSLDPLEAWIFRALQANGMILRDGATSGVELYGLDAVNQGGNASAWGAVGVTLPIDGYARVLSSAIPWHLLEPLHPPT